MYIFMSVKASLLLFLIFKIDEAFLLTGLKLVEDLA